MTTKYLHAEQQRQAAQVTLDNLHRAVGELPAKVGSTKQDIRNLLDQLATIQWMLEDAEQRAKYAEAAALR